MVETSATASAFDFSGGRLCLDLTNTLSERLGGSPVELLNTYIDVLTWSRQANILDDEEATRLRVLATSEPGSAEALLASIKQVRELIYRIFSALTAGHAARPEDIEQFNQVLARSMAHARLVPGASGFTWGWAGGSERPLWQSVYSAADLLTSDELGCVRICASENCGWLFLDTSKNHSRRWCDMKSCGNRAKARRHYDRKKDAGSE